MRLRLPQALIAVLLLFALLPAVGRAQSRESLSLDGIWDFATDLDSQGEIEKWYAPDTALPKMPTTGSTGLSARVPSLPSWCIALAAGLHWPCA